MKNIDNHSILISLAKLSEVFENHGALYHSLPHTHGYASGYVRLNNYARELSQIGHDQLTLKEAHWNMEVDERKIKTITNRYKDIPEVQATMIHFFNDAVNCQTLISSTINESEKNSFIHDLYTVLAEFEEYLPPDVVSNIHSNLYHGVIDAEKQLSTDRIAATSQSIATSVKSGTTFFSKLPHELNKEIARLAKLSIHNKDESMKIASQEYDQVILS